MRQPEMLVRWATYEKVLNNFLREQMRAEEYSIVRNMVYQNELMAACTARGACEIKHGLSEDEYEAISRQAWEDFDEEYSRRNRKHKRFLPTGQTPLQVF